MQPHHSPRVRSLGFATVVLAIVAATFLLTPGSALAAPVGCHPGGDSSWVLQEAQLAQPNGSAGAPVTDGRSVYWADDSSGNLDLYAADLESGTQSTVVDGDGNQYDPAVAHGFVAYVDDSSGSPMIMGLDTSSSDGPFAISSEPGEHPATDGDYVVWSTPNTSDNANIMGYDLSTGTEFTICDAAGAQINPAISDGVVVWQDDRNGNWDIYGARIGDQSPARAAGRHARGREGRLRAGRGRPVLGLHRRRRPDQPRHQLRLRGLAGRPQRQLGHLRRPHRRPCQPEPQDATLVRGQLVRGKVGCDETGEIAICTADGDQTDPSVAGPLVVWTDARSGADATDIYGYNLEDQTEFPVCTADGPQTHADVADDGTIAWLDGRGGGQYPAIYAATWVPGGDPSNPTPTNNWTSDSLITMFLSVFNQMGVFSDFRVSFDGGATWSDWQAFADVDQLQLPGGDGAKTISLQFEDADGNQTPVISITVYLDTHGPTTVAPVVSHARTGKVALIRFKVKDALSPKANVTVRLRNRHGKLVRVIRLGERRTNRLLSARFTCNLRRGTYRFAVLAKDLAGNKQVKAGMNRLIVR